MRLVFDKPWTVMGCTPVSWALRQAVELNIALTPEVPPVPAPVPGSVQRALRDGGVLPDWNRGLQSLDCEWVEHRDWIYETTFDAPDIPQGRSVYLHAQGLDGFGFVTLNHHKVGDFRNGFVPHRFLLDEALKPGENRLEILFTDLPRFCGTPNISRNLTEWKARFNYAWDWMPRNVQIGIWDALYLEVEPEWPLGDVRVETDAEPTSGTGCLRVTPERALEGGTVRVLLARDGAVVREDTVSAESFSEGVYWDDLSVELWQPNGQGAQPLYALTVERVGSADTVSDRKSFTVGFRRISWAACAGAPKGADPWICEVNGTPVFLSGVNWTPIRAHYADVTEEQYRQRITMYRDLGMNTLRVWGGAFLEKECFYRLCDEMGMLVWQEFPLSSSGPDNTPPLDEASVAAMEQIARSYVRRRRHHASLFIWCGGNELQHDGKYGPGVGTPYGLEDHPMLKRIGEVVKGEDPRRRYLPCSSSGPRFMADERDFGKGLHWDVHGPWRLPEEDWAAGERYWARDDSLFRSETGAPGASPLDVLEAYRGECELQPLSLENPYWRRTSWWLDRDAYQKEKGCEPSDIADYVKWSQDRQARALHLAVSACRKRFPAMGGILLWMGHDSFPCPANTSILDFHGRPKPAAHAVAAALRGESWPPSAAS